MLFQVDSISSDTQNGSYENQSAYKMGHSTKPLGSYDNLQPEYHRPVVNTGNQQTFQGFERNINGQFECPYCDRSYNSPAVVKGNVSTSIF